MKSEKVVSMQAAVLDRLAAKFQSYLAQDASNREEWIEIQLGKCLIMLEMREQFPADIEFGRWWNNDSGIKNTVNHQTRAAMVAMGRDPDALRACLEATGRRSLETIYYKEFDRFTKIRKPGRRRAENLEDGKSSSRKPPTPKKQQHAEAVLARLLNEGREVNRTILAEVADVSPGTAARAFTKHELEERAKEKVRGKVEPLDPEKVSSNTRERMEAWQRAERKRLREEIHAEVSAEIKKLYDEIFIKAMREKVDRAERIIKAHNGVFTPHEFKFLKMCVHPDNSASVTVRNWIFDLVSMKEDVLVKEKERELGSSGLPRTAAELMARRRVKK